MTLTWRLTFRGIYSQNMVDMFYAQIFQSFHKEFKKEFDTGKITMFIEDKCIEITAYDKRIEDSFRKSALKFKSRAELKLLSAMGIKSELIQDDKPGSKE